VRAAVASVAGPNLDFSRVAIDGLDLTTRGQSSLPKALFQTSPLTRVSFRGLALERASFDGAVLDEVDFAATDLSDASFAGTASLMSTSQTLM